MADPLKKCPICAGKGHFIVKPTKSDEKKGYKKRIIGCDTCDSKGVLGVVALKLPGT